MKKFASLVAVAVAALGMTGCGKKTDTIHLQLVPSNDPSVLLTRAKALAPMLKKFVPEYDWSIDVGTTYAATTTALAAGQIDGGFLTASGYAQMTIEQPNAVELLLSAGRAGYKVQADDFPGVKPENLEAQRKHMNGADGYVYRGEQSTTLVNYYCSVVLTLKDSAREAKNLAKLDADNDGEVTLQEIHKAGAVWGTMGATSSAGFIYPTKYIFDKGFTNGFIDKAAYATKTDAEKSKYMINAEQKSYPAMIEALMEGTIDVAVGFMDIRYGSAFVQQNSKYKGDDKLFTDTYTQAILDPIMNDTVCAYSKLDAKKKDAIKRALKAAVKDGKKDTEGTGAWILYQIYSHTAYVDGKDEDYNASRDMYKWSLAHSGK